MVKAQRYVFPPTVAYRPRKEGTISESVPCSVKLSRPVVTERLVSSMTASVGDASFKIDGEHFRKIPREARRTAHGGGRFRQRAAGRATIAAQSLGPTGPQCAF